MLQATTVEASDDVAIRCSVRHSEYATNRQFNEPQEMMCTMRVWHKTRTPGSSFSRTIQMKKTRSFGSPALDSIITPDWHSHSHPQQQLQHYHQGPEIILSPMIESQQIMMLHACCSGDLADPVQLSERFVSFGSGDCTRKSPHRRRESPKQLGEVTIPVADIMVVDMYGQRDSHRTNITTMSHGFFELTLESRNGQEVLLAFLKASLPKERVMEGLLARSPSQLSQNTNSSSNKSFDVEAFTASRMAERVSNESLSERIRRKVRRAVSSFEEISTVITDCACGCSKNAQVSPDPAPVEKRDSPPRSHLQYEGENDTSVDRSLDMATGRKSRRYGIVDGGSVDKRLDMLKNSHMPSGLSVECDPELETTTGY